MLGASVSGLLAGILLARQGRFRLEAEAVRDVNLAVSGLLNPKIGGPSIKPPLPPDLAALSYAGGLKWTETTGADQQRRFVADDKLPRGTGSEELSAWATVARAILNLDEFITRE